MKKLLVLFILAAYNSYGQSALNFYINFDSGSVSTQLRWPNDTLYFNDSTWLFIDTVHYRHNQWQIGRPQKSVFNAAYSYPNAILTDTLHHCLPSDTSAFILKLPKNAWLGLIWMSFRYKLDIDSGDKAFIEWSADTGTHWAMVLTDTNGLFTYQGDTNLTISTSGWASMTLAPYYPPWQSTETPTGTYFLRFTLITDSSTMPRDGWMIDNIYAGYDGEGIPILSNNPNINIYPNPSSTAITITALHTIKTVSITNLLGEVISTNQYNTDVVQVDVKDLPAGIYFVRINGTEVRKFVKQ
jgi:hypothetical protein